MPPSPSLLLAAALVALAASAPAAPGKGVPAAARAPAPAFTAAEAAAARLITQAEISAHTRFLADDLLEGRFPGGRGSELAIRYLAAQLEALGLRPGIPGPPGSPAPSWLQPVPLVRHSASVPEALVFARGKEQLVLPTGPGVEAAVVLRSLGDTDRVRLEAAGLVFVGYGIVAPEHGWDDYRGADVRGKVVVLLNHNPPWAGEGVRLWYGRWDYKYLEAARHGAVGALIVHTDASAGYPWQVVASSNRSVGVALPPEGEPRVSFQGWIGHDATERLFHLGGRELAADEARAKAASGGAAAVPLEVALSLDLPVARERFESANVVGTLPGSDARLAEEAVVFIAHHDHLGMRSPPLAGQRNVYAGALDNASGCAALLAIARAAASARPRRSLSFAFVTAEEQGLLGARWLALHPPLPAGRIAAAINLDMVNRWGRATDYTLHGLGKSSLDEVVRAAAAAQGRTVHGDPFPSLGLFYRSDHFEFARVGVPVVYGRGGPQYAGRPAGWGKERHEEFIARDYHQPLDVYPPAPEAWDLAGAVEDAQLQLVVGLRVADAPEPPRWNPGDEFEAARLKAARQVH